MRTLPTAVVTVLALGALAAACGTTPATVTQANATHPTSHDTVVTATTEAPSVPVTSSQTGQTTPVCATGVVGASAAVGQTPAPVCLVEGSTLIVIFDKSHAAVGRPGPWGRPLVQAQGSVVHIRSAMKKGHQLIVQLTARQPGTTTVIAGFGQECAAGDTTPCTIPPQAILSVPVTVVPRPQP